MALTMATTKQMILRNAGFMFVIILLPFNSQATSTPANNSHQHRLMGDLMENYNKYLRPVYNISTVTEVTYWPALAQILDVDEKHFKVSLSLWLRQEWKDEFLRWNPADYDGIKVLRLSTKLLWTPDIVLYNNVDAHPPELWTSNAIVSSDGKVHFNGPVIHQCHCDMNLDHYPFDNQKCDVIFGSWTYDTREIDLYGKEDGADTSVYLANGEWILNGAPVRREVRRYNCCGDSYARLIMTVDITRKPLYFLVNMLAPNVVIVLITVWGFFLPPASGERATLFVTTFLSLIVFQQVILNVIPPTADHVPFITRYFTALSALVTLSCCLTIGAVHVHYRSAVVKPVPDWLFNLALCHLAPILCMGSSERRSPRNSAGEDKARRSGGVTFLGFANPGSSYQVSGRTPAKAEETRETTTSPNQKRLDDIIEKLTYLTSRQEARQRRSESLREWELVVAVIDRVLMICMLVILLSVTVIFLR